MNIKVSHCLLVMTFLGWVHKDVLKSVFLVLILRIQYIDSEMVSFHFVTVLYSELS